MRSALAGCSVPHVDEFTRLATDRGGPKVSLFLPTRRTGPAGLPARVRFANLVRGAEHLLRTDGMSNDDIATVMGGARDLVEDLWLWERPADGLALFADSGATRTYWVQATLPEMAIAGDRFVVTPLLPTFNARGRFLVLQLTRAETRLLAGDRSGFSELTSLGAPADGPALDTHFQLVDAVIRDAAGQPEVPLVVVGEPRLQSAYRRTNTWPGLVTPTTTGIEDWTSLETIHRLVWQVVEPELRARELAAADSVQALRSMGRTLHEPARVVAAAERGDVHTLIVATESTWWGRRPDEPVVVRLQEEPTPSEQLGTAAVAVLGHGGSVFTVPARRMPRNTTTAALLRP